MLDSAGRPFRTETVGRRRGLIIAHNVLWYGTVVKGEHGGVTRCIKEFNQMLYSTPGLVTSIVPLWDGLAISLKE